MKKKKFFLCKIAALFMVFFTVFTFISPSAAYADNKQFLINLKYGYGGQIQANYYAPYDVTITNNGSDFEGSVLLYIPGRESTLVAHEQPLSIGAGATKTVHFTAVCNYANPTVKIEIRNKKDKPVFSDETDIASSAVYTDMVNVGIITDDYSALAYLSGKTFVKMPSASLSLSRISADTLPDDPKALDMLDAIILTNFSTDSFSETQRISLLSWTNAGGLLIIGTGDSSSKTLSGIDELVNISVSGPVNASTAFGMNDTVFGDYKYDSNNYSRDFMLEAGAVNLYGLIDFENYLADYYAAIELGESDVTLIDACSQKILADYKDEIISNCWILYFGIPYESYSFGPEAVRDFESFAEYELLPELIKHYLKESKKNQAIDSYPEVEAVLCKTDFGSPLVMCDSEASDIPFASYAGYGKGYICVLATDITKSPFVNYPDNSRLIVHIIESLSGGRISERLNSYGYIEGDYTLASLLDSISSQKMIPMLVFVLMIFGYTITAFVLYFVLRKKNKTVLIWPLQACLAVVFSILIFLVAIPTRNGSASVSTARIITDINGTASEKTAAVILMPSSKHYEIPFSSNYNVSEANLDSRYYYGSRSSLEKDKYTICYSKGIDNTVIKYNSLSAMTSVSLELARRTPVSSGLEFECTYDSGSLQGHITNNTGKTIRDAYICVDFAYFAIGELFPGETLDLSELEGISLVKEVRANEIIINPIDKLLFDSKVPVAPVLFGTGNKAHQKEANRRALFAYIKESYLYDIPGYYYNSTMYNFNVFSPSDVEYYITATPDVLAELGPSCGLDGNGFIGQSHSAPLLIAFTENGESALKDTYKNENVAEAIVVTSSLNKDFAPVIKYVYGYGDIYYNGQTATRERY